MSHNGMASLKLKNLEGDYCRLFGDVIPMLA